MSQPPIAEQTILAAFPAGEDRTALDSMLRPPDWQLQFTQAFDEARVVLRTAPVGMLICDERFPGDYNWKDLLHELHQMPAPPPLIVTGHESDAALWAEVLNLGGYDLLVRPLNATEVLRTVNMAWRFRQCQWEQTAALRKPPVADGSLSGKKSRAASGSGC